MSTHSHSAGHAGKHSIPSSRSRRKSPKIIAIVIAAVVVIGGAFAVFKLLGNHVEPGQPVTVTIDEGSSTRTIASELKDAGVIASDFGFTRYVDGNGLATSLKPGTYNLTTGMSDEDAAKALVAGPGITGTAVTIREGLTINETARAVHKALPRISAKEYKKLAKSGAETYAADYPFLKGAYDDSLEGYLFPKTYDVPDDATADTLIRMQLDQFATEIASVDLSYAEKKGLSQADVVTMASMVEKEAQVEGDRPKIASVVYNRLAQDMRLQMDSTVYYALGESSDGGLLSTEDTRTESPYNTYLSEGLPPGPICNPGLACIEACAHPAETKYLYYVTTSKDGSQTFCETYDEFLEAKEKYKEVFGVD